MTQHVVSKSVPTGVLVTLKDATDPERCGHKAAALAELLRQGFDVPAGFVIPVDAAATIAELEAALRRIGNRPVAVRSSGVGEDLPDTAHAGQYDTVLNVRAAEGIQDAAARVRQSARSARNAGYVQATASMGVLVQMMVDADVAGVAFSANPLTGARDEVIVSATRGLADQLLAGHSDGDEWSVHAGVARRTSGAETAIDAPLAVKVASLVRRVEMARGRPQDIEWAIENDHLWLLQARPITALPVAPAIEAPRGTWQKDAGHYPEPVSPFAASTHLRDTGQAQAMLDEWGLMPDRASVRVIGHEFYVHMEPDDEGRNPPPWWVLGLAARLVPSLRRKLKTAQRAVDSGLLESLPAQWESEFKPRLERELRAFLDLDLTTLSDEKLCAHLDELMVFSARNMELHFRLNVPHALGVFELAQACRELLGWDPPQAMLLLQGLSTASSAPMRELAAIAATARERPRTRAAIASWPHDIVSELDAADPELAERLRAYLKVWGVRTIGAEAGKPSLAECPGLLAESIADLMATTRSVEVSARREQLVAEARAQLPGPGARERFDRTLAYAERAYPLREDNVILTDHLPVGLLRRVALEAGRRLVERGLLAGSTDAVMLTAAELQAAIVTSDGSHSDLRATILRRKCEHAWVRAHPGPAVYGAKPGPMPDLRGLPDAARRLNGALLWELAQELGAKTSVSTDAIGGIAASPGIYRGRVRVIRAAQDLVKLRTGEVLVCPETSSAWMMVFRRAGALVTDHGSALSHTAIVAREFALPAVVATAHGTAMLRDGDEVIVDGNRGTVTRC